VSVDNVASAADEPSINRDPDKYIQELIFGDIFENVGNLQSRSRGTSRSTGKSQRAHLSLFWGLHSFFSRSVKVALGSALGSALDYAPGAILSIVLLEKKEPRPPLVCNESGRGLNVCGA